MERLIDFVNNGISSGRYFAGGSEIVITSFITVLLQWVLMKPQGECRLELI